MNDEEQELKQYLEQIFLERGKLQSTEDQQSIADAIKEGNTLLKKEEKKKKTPAAKKPRATHKKKELNNPYANAKDQLLDKMEKWKREEIIQMENSGNTDNKIYVAFIKEVAILGDSLS